MLAWYPAEFDREMGCSEAELLSWLPGAAGARPIETSANGASVAIQDGHLHLHWKTLAPRQIALLRLPRLAVAFRFEAVDEAARNEFMRFFDLYTQRGGG